MNPETPASPPPRPRPFWGWLTIVVFLGLLWLPTLDDFFHLDHAPVPDENRLPAKWPVFKGLKQTQDFLGAVEKYFNDHFGFRKRLVRLNHHWKRQLFRDAVNPYLLVGRDGWMFYSGDRLVERCTRTDLWSEEELENWRRLLEGRRDWLRARGAKYLFVVTPDKHTVYPEYLPAWLKTGTGPTKVQQLMSYMKAHSTVEVLDLSQALIEGKNKRVAYLKTDTHWNMFGGFVGYRALVESLARQFPGMAPLPLDALDWKPAPPAPGGDLARLMGNTDSCRETENVEAVALKPLVPLQKVYDPVRLPQSGMKEMWPFFTLNTNACGRAIVVRDSFACSWYAYLAQHFREVIYLWKYENGRPQYEWNIPLIEREKPDVVIDEMLERFFCTEDPLALARKDKLSEVKASSFIHGAVRSETGFDGAVTVAQEDTVGNTGVVTVNVPYLDVRGKPKLGQARLIVRQEELRSQKPVPILLCPYYEIKVEQAEQWCNQGWAVVTPHYGIYPREPSLGDGLNLDHAIVEWVRRLPFVDRRHLQVHGESQGGYVALAITADFLPVEAVTVTAPIINWDYNICYFETNKAVSKFPQADFEKSPLPFFYPVVLLADQICDIFGPPSSSDTYYYLSPLSCLDRITSPALVVWSTADMLVPLEQVTRTRLANFDRRPFPAGYLRDFGSLTKCDRARKVFEDAVPADSIHWNLLPLQEGTYEYLIGMMTGKQKRPAKGPKDLALPWSPNHQWSICLLDEGGAVPYASHKRYTWSLNQDNFAAAHRQKPCEVGLLNLPKLEYLLNRYMGQSDQRPKLADGNHVNRLNYDLLEKRDVLAGLLDYANMGEAYARHLVTLYSASSTHPLGRDLSIAALQEQKDSFDKRLAAGP